jgi:hypothetical protein
VILLHEFIIGDACTKVLFLAGNGQVVVAFIDQLYFCLSAFCLLYFRHTPYGTTEGTMNQEQPIISYDRFMPKPLEERIRIFNDVSAENRAELMKTHIERWLAANRRRLTGEQVAVVEEIIPFITPEKYRADRDAEKVVREVEVWQEKAEAVFSREELRQMVSESAEYVPAVGGERD